jgi:cobalt-zinc-cadmium efflux system outer membrane protein
VLAAGQTLSLLEEELRLRERGLDVVRRQRELGEGNQLDVATTELEVAEVRRELRKTRADAAAERFGLNRLLGLPPEYDLKLTESGSSLTFTIYDDVPDAEIDHRVLAGRPELASAAAAYREAEEQLRLAALEQYPRIGIGPAYERELEGENALGLGLSLELPVFDRNQAGIAEKRAQRERRRAEYTALLHGLRTDALAARSSLRLAAQEVEAQGKEVLPLVKRTEELTERAFRIRELSAIELTTAQQRALRARREYLEALVRYGTAVIELETATGMRLSQAASPPASQPSLEPAPTAPATPPGS